jgi:hypothetical protein
MKRTRLRRRTNLRATAQLRRSKPLQRTASMAATERQRSAVAGRCCVVCGTDRRIDPAHLIPRSLGGCGDAACCVPLCRPCHRAYDRGELDLLPYLYLQWAIISSPLRLVAVLSAVMGCAVDAASDNPPREWSCLSTVRGP